MQKWPSAELTPILPPEKLKEFVLNIYDEVLFEFRNHDHEGNIKTYRIYVDGKIEGFDVERTFIHNRFWDLVRILHDHDSLLGK